MHKIYTSVTQFFADELYMKLFWVLVILVVGIIVIRTVRYFLLLLIASLAPQHQLIIRKTVIYTLDLTLLIVVLSYTGVDLAALLGTVGILGIIVGIASQSAIGNIISGIFLISENAFQIGDVIKLDTFMGTVHSIDLLAIKLKTFDNVLVRIPNQTLLTAKLTNVSKFPFRRLDFELRVPNDANLPQIKDILKNIVNTTTGCLVQPEPVVVFKGFGLNGIEIMLGVWFEKEDYLTVKNDVLVRIQTDFMAAGITIPYTEVSVHNSPGSIEVK